MLFARARRRLTLAYVAMFALVLAAFSIVFFMVLAVVLQPAFDIAPEVPAGEAGRRAYEATLERIGLAVMLADAITISLVGIGAWILAARTLRPVREAHERQRRFVADASHEMRSPLTAIRSTTDAALLPDAPRGAAEAALEVVARESDRLGQLTSDLLVLAQSDDGTLRPRAEPFDLSVLVAEHLAAKQAVGQDGARFRHSDVQLSLTPDLRAEADPQEVLRIVDNLVSNAVLHGGRGAKVRVSVRAMEREAVVEVADDGPGIITPDLERIFEPFYRASSDANAPAGTGLGLPIAASLARRNGGRLAVESRLGQGSTFRLTLPRVH